MANGWIWEAYITLCCILLCFIHTCNGTSRMTIQPLKFTFTKSNQCSHNRGNCNENVPTTSACKPVFGFQLFHSYTDINVCTPTASYSDKYCPFCKYTNPLTDLHSDVSKELSPLIFQNLTKMPVALYILMTYGDETVLERLEEQCIKLIAFRSLRDLNITRNINNLCYSFDFRISISCEEFFYGDKCDIECHPSKDNSTEHLICDENGTKICGPGWRGHNCTEVDYCFQTPCENNGTCHNNNSYYECNCTQGFEGHNCSETTYTTEYFTTDEVTYIDSSSTFQVTLNHQTSTSQNILRSKSSHTQQITTTVSYEESTKQTESEVNGNQQSSTTENIPRILSTPTVQSSRGCIHTPCNARSTPTKKATSTVSYDKSREQVLNKVTGTRQTSTTENTSSLPTPIEQVTSTVLYEKSREQVPNKALPPTTVAIAGASGGGVILIAVIAVVCVIRLRKRNRELEKKIREIKEIDSQSSILRDNPIHEKSFPTNSDTKVDKKEEEEKKHRRAAENPYESYL